MKVSNLHVGWLVAIMVGAVLLAGITMDFYYDIQDAKQLKKATENGGA